MAIGRLSVDGHDSPGAIALITGANQESDYAWSRSWPPEWSPQDLVLLHRRNPSRVSEARARAAAAPTSVARVEGGQLDVTGRRRIARWRPRRRAARRDRRSWCPTPRQNHPRPAQREQADEFIAVANALRTAILRSFGRWSSGRALDHRGQFPGHLGNLENACTRCLRTPPRPGRKSLVRVLATPSAGRGRISLAVDSSVP